MAAKVDTQKEIIFGSSDPNISTWCQRDARNLYRMSSDVSALSLEVKAETTVSAIIVHTTDTP